MASNVRGIRMPRIFGVVTFEQITEPTNSSSPSSLIMNSWLSHFHLFGILSTSQQTKFLGNLPHAYFGRSEALREGTRPGGGLGSNAASGGDLKIDVKKVIIKFEPTMNQLDWASKPSEHQKTNSRSSMAHTQAVTVPLRLRIFQLHEH